MLVASPSSAITLATATAEAGSGESSTANQTIYSCCRGKVKCILIWPDDVVDSSYLDVACYFPYLAATCSSRYE